jgi:hypothetical protein
LCAWRRRSSELSAAECRLQVRIKEGELLFKWAPPIGRGDLQQVDEHCAQAALYLELALPGAADLVAGEGHVIGPARTGQEYSRTATHLSQR